MPGAGPAMNPLRPRRRFFPVPEPGNVLQVPKFQHFWRDFSCSGDEAWHGTCLLNRRVRPVSPAPSPTKTYQQTETMKLVKIISLGLIALFLGACASKPSQQSTVPAGPTTVISAK